MGKAASRMAHNDFYHLVITHLCLEVHKCVITPSLKVDGREQPTSKRASQVALVKNLSANAGDIRDRRNRMVIEMVVE